MEITNKQQAAAGYTEVDPQAYEAVLNGKPVHLYTLTNKQGLIVKISNFGARLVQVLVPDRNGQLGDVTLGYDTLDEPGPTSCPAAPPSAATPTVSTKASSPWTGKRTTCP